MADTSREFSKSLVGLMAVALLTFPGAITAQTETPQERAEKQREAQEKAAEQRREAQERAEKREAEQKAAEERREGQERAEQREAQQQRVEQQREARPREAAPRPSAPQPVYTPQAQSPPSRPEARPPAQTVNPGVRSPATPSDSSGGQTYRPGGQTPEPVVSPGPSYRPPTVYTIGGPSSQPSGLNSGTGATKSNGTTIYTIHAPVSSPGIPQANVPPASQPNGARVLPTATAPVRATPRTVYTAPAASSVASRTPAGTSVLNPSGSQAVVKQINGSRTGLHGVNGRPLPAGNVTVQPNGTLTLATEKGGQYAVRSNGTVASIGAPGRSVNFRPDGRVSGLHTGTVDIERGVRGERIIRTARPDKSVLVGTGGRNGYLERTVVAGNRSIIQRTYVTGGRVYVRAFVAYPAFGRSLPLYVPSVYLAPAFYGWAFYPWAAPVPYAWAWAGAAWFGYYSGYYQPYAAYPGASAWLADYLLSQTLANAYAMQNQAPPLPGYGDDSGDPTSAVQPIDGELYAQNDTPITPDLRNAIADEVGRQLAYENAVASGTAQQTCEELPNSLKPDRVFVVSTTLDVSTSDGQVCELTGGDVLRVTAPPASDSPAATLRVASGKRQDCPAGVDVSISVRDLAEMQNNLRAQMDAGLETLRSSPAGLPQAPQSAMAPVPRPVLDVPLPPDPNVAGLLDAQQKDAQRTEIATVQAITGGNQ